MYMEVEQRWVRVPRLHLSLLRHFRGLEGAVMLRPARVYIYLGRRLDVILILRDTSYYDGDVTG